MRIYEEVRIIRATKQEIERIFRKMEEKYNLRKGVLSQIYCAEADVVFMGRRRNILKEIRRIIIPAHGSTGEEAK